MATTRTAASRRARASSLSAALAAIAAFTALGACAREVPTPVARPALPAPPTEPAPACPAADAGIGPWPRAAGVARVAPGTGRPGHLEQQLGGAPARLRFLGAHLFDLLDKIEHEAGPNEDDRRRVICAAIEAAAARGAPVVRLWGSLKRTGTSAEVARAAELLALVLDENARRKRPLRFVITLLNHQSGYGAPRPEASLDDQDPRGAWSARRIYLEGAWRARGEGQLHERIEAISARAEIVGSPYILAWELVNELDTHRAVAGGSLRGPEADALRDGFLVPALGELAARFPQPIMAGDLRGHDDAYEGFARGLLAALPAPVRARLVWTSHVYAPLGAGPEELARSTRKLDRDLAIAAEHGLPFVLGELGQRAPGERRFCGDGALPLQRQLPLQLHDPARLFTSVLDTRPAIEAALFWGEGHCALPVSGPSARRITIGAGGDSADLAPGDAAARDAVRAARRWARFRIE